MKSISKQFTEKQYQYQIDTNKIKGHLPINIKANVAQYAKLNPYSKCGVTNNLRNFNTNVFKTQLEG
jgi:hypothetical protein